MALPNTRVNYITRDPFVGGGTLNTTGFYAAGDGFLAETSDGAQNWTDLSGVMGTPPNDANDSPAPAVSDLDFTQIIADPFTNNQIVAIGGYTNGGGDYRAWVVKRDGSNVWTWKSVAAGGSGLDPDAGGAPSWDINVNPDNETYANDDAVTTITNSAGTNATGGNDPTFKTNVINGKSVYRFDGTNDYKDFGTGFGKPANFSIFMLVELDDNTAIKVAFGSQQAGVGSTTWGRVGNDGGARWQYQHSDGTNTSYGVTQTILQQGTYYVIGIRYTNGDDHQDIWINGVQVIIATETSTAATSNSGTAYGLSVGRPGENNNFYWDGDIGRILYIDSALTDSQMEGYSLNLASYYDLATVTGEARAISTDIDRHAGTTFYTVSWDASDLLIQKRTVSSLATSTVTTLGAATNTELDNRTYYARVFCVPSTFGTADTIYVFGRWDDGSVRHIQKSTDGGATLTDIGDSATWGTGWVSAFFATDANNLYAFVAGASRALYRSQDAGTSWTKLSDLPTNFDAEAASLGADGRLAIVNLNSGGQQVATAESPSFASWTDISGSIPTNGKGSVVWV